MTWLTHPICKAEQYTYQFIIHGLPVVSCPMCGLFSISTEPINNEYDTFYKIDLEDNELGALIDTYTERSACDGYLKLLNSYFKQKEINILLLAPLDHIFASLAQSSWIVTQHETADTLETAELKSDFDAVVILYQLEKSYHPAKLLQKVYAALKPGGVLMIITPSLDSTSAQFFGRQWTEWRSENRYYFNQITIQLLLWRMGFNQLTIRKDRRKYTLAHITDRARAFPKTWITRIIQTAYHVVPASLQDFRLRLPSSGMVVTAVRNEMHEPQICSVVIPAFNEGETFKILMDAVIAKQLPNGMGKEIIVVESNSKDGTREQVLKYQNLPGVKIVLQDRALGKGNAVRAGFSQATGDVLYIQDADLEYDLNDLDVLLEPIIKYQTPFVLGSRHGGKWKMREFVDEKGLSTFFNFGHFLFTSLLNILYGQRMKDPFTMYKVFRRDCLHGLVFESNRFDFDFELVIKLIRKGYTPLEIPVNYRSRSYKEGKKVRIFRDPFTWIRALVKYRFDKI